LPANSVGGAVLAQLLIGALGVIAVTGDYSSGTIRSTLAAIPRRGLVLSAKAVVYGAAALVLGLGGSLAALFAGQLAISGTPIPRGPLTDPDVARTVLLTGVYLGVIGLIGVGLGAIIRHSGGAIGTLFGALFLPMIVAGMFGKGGLPVTRFVPLMMLLNSISVLGYLLKDRVADVAEFTDALTRVASGGTALDPEVVGHLIRSGQHATDLTALTPANARCSPSWQKAARTAASPKRWS
jgi:hypothetical protein